MKRLKKNIIYFNSLIMTSRLIYYFFIFTFYILHFTSESNAQDVHLSQFYVAPMYYNPSNMAITQNKARAGLDYKSQWSSISKPYVTQLAFYENKIIPKSFKTDWAGMGVILYNDMAGDINLHTMKASLLASYHKSILEENKLFASFGASFGVVNKSFDASKLIFDSQWTSSGFDNSIPSDEMIYNTSYIYTDFAAGTMLTYNHSNEISANIGGSLQHLNRPRETSFFESENRIGVKTVLNAGIDFKIDEKLFFLPKLIVSSQKKAKEMLYGLNISYAMKETQLYMGLWNRAKSDIIIMGGVDFDNLTIVLSYDVNYSKLNVATNYRGGFEISISKRFGKRNDRIISAGKKTSPML